ncbi:hypothetical protein J2W17_006123 [Pseudomonas lini]|uniref:hypothetical protein n=1 Tax=Pseudomonas lini TaxID=163011 RepID=UPI00277DBBEA|nr:hypothetical protein [Pseudomonas lini]MDQ0127125.1 hypothetical protein [Pseudomonas lini]
MLAIDHHGTRTAANQLKLTLDVFNQFDGLLVNISLGTSAGGENEDILHFLDLHPIFCSISQSPVQSVMTEFFCPRQLMKLLDDGQHKINASENE